MKKLTPVRLGLSILSVRSRAVALGLGGSILLAVHQVSACPFCYGAKDGKSAENMSVAIWFLFAAIMAVLGGVGAFSYSIYRHGRAPLTPDQKLMEENLEKYE